MEDLTTVKKVVRFGLFEVDFPSQELRKSGIKIKIQDQPFQILALLLERPGQFVTREEIQKRLWAGDTFVDFDLGLNSAVKKLRQALGDESENPRFVETLYRRGYRFLVPVQGDAPADAPVTAVPPKPSGGADGQEIHDRHDFKQIDESVPTRKNARRLLGYLLLPLLLVIGLLAGYGLRPRATPRITGYQQITQDGRQKFRIVSDGDRLYTQEYDSGRFVVSQVSAAGGETSTLQTPFTNVMLGNITPDGSALLLGEFQETNKQVRVWSLPLPTGAPRRLGDLVVESLAPSPDGKSFIVSNSDGVSEARGAYNLAVSPDGKRISFSLEDTRTGTSGIWVAGRDGSNPHALFPNDVDSEHDSCARWTPDGKYLLFARYSQGHENIWAFSVDDSWFKDQPRAMQLTNGPLDFSEPVPSRDGKKIFAVGAQPRTELIRYDGKSGFGPFLGGL
jgi:DNA-binding winged helix-turn-helix (wHTH) protein/WD40 repeat protein